MDIRTSIKKEVLEGLRNYRFLIITVSILFFAIFDPLMSKLVLPELLKSQFPNMPLDVMRQMLITSQAGNIRGYMGNVYQLSTLIITFSLSGLLAQELSEKTLILPISTGKRYEDVLAGKMIVYGIFLLLITTVSALVNYYYTGVLFGFQLPSALPALRAGLLMGVHMLYLLSLLLIFGSLLRKPIAAGMVTLLVVFSTRGIGSLFNIQRYLPSGLLVEAEMLAASPSVFLWGTLATTLALVIVLVCLTVIRLSNLELTRG